MRKEALFPPEVSTKCFCVMVIGGESVRIEQHKGLLAYQEDRIVFQTESGQIHICGRNFTFQSYTADEAFISGQISGVTLEGRK